MTAPRSFTPEERRAWVPLTAMLELLPRYLDGQLTRDEDLTHFDYGVLSMLALTKGRTLRMSALASGVNANLSRLSHAVSRLERRGLLYRTQATDDARATDVTLTPDGRRKVIHATPGHVATVREHVLDALDAEQLEQLHTITQAILERLDPEKKLMASRMT